MSHRESAARGPDARLVDRMLFFTDAVFAIVLTLLALELRLPALETESDAALWPALAAMGEHFAAFFISFALVSVWWAVHMRVTQKLIQFDWPTAICNLLCLVCVTLLPFASTVFGEHFLSTAALQIYWTICAATAFAMTLMFVVMTRDKGRLVGGMGPGEWVFRLIQSLAPAIAFSVGVYAASVGNLWLSRFSWMLMFPLMMLGRLFYRAPKAAAPAP